MKTIKNEISVIGIALGKLYSRHRKDAQVSLDFACRDSFGRLFGVQANYFFDDHDMSAPRQIMDLIVEGHFYRLTGDFRFYEIEDKDDPTPDLDLFGPVIEALDIERIEDELRDSLSRFAQYYCPEDIVRKGKLASGVGDQNIKFICAGRSCPKVVKQLANVVDGVTCKKLIDHPNYPSQHVSNFGCLTMERSCLPDVLLPGTGLVFVMVDLGSEDSLADALSVVDSIVSVGVSPIIPYDAENIREESLQQLKQAGASVLHDSSSLSNTRGVIEAIVGVMTPGYINVDFDDLNLVFAQGTTASVIKREARGENRAKDVVKLLKSAFGSQLEGGRNKIGRVLVCVACPDLKIDEFAIVVNMIADNVGEDTTIITGTANDGPEEGIVVTIVVS